MKITNLRTLYSERCHYVIIETDEGITGLGDATLHTRDFAVDAVLQQLKTVLTGQDPMRIEHIWQDIFRGTFWRGGPVLMSALSAVDLALWDIKGKALNTPVYNLLGGKCRDKLKAYIGIVGDTGEALAEDALRRVEQGYKVLRFCPVADNGYIIDQQEYIRKGEKQMATVRKAVGEDIDIIFECHTRLNPVAAMQLANRLEQYRPMFIEDPLRADSPESFRMLRQHTNVPLGTGEKYGAFWDYKTLIEEDLVDYLRPDVCNCGGISMMRKIANYGETHYLELVPHGVHHAGFLGAMHVDFAVENFAVQEDWFSASHPEWLDYEVNFEDGYLTMADRPGLGVILIESEIRPSEVMWEHPHYRRSDGSVADY